MSETVENKMIVEENISEVSKNTVEKPIKKKFVKPIINYEKVTIDGEIFEIKSAGFLLYKLINGNYFIFMIKETNKTTGEEYFAEPGGKFEEKDGTAFNCALREFQEETKISIQQYLKEEIIPFYIKSAKYNMYPVKIPIDFQFEGDYNGDFVQITEDLPLHPRSNSFIREFVSQ